MRAVGWRAAILQATDEERDVVKLYDLGGDGMEEASDRVLTWANGLSFARLLILPWLYMLLADGRLALGLAVGFVFGVTDFVDGYVARRFDQVTKLGKLLDPFSDRLFIATIAVGVVVAGLLPWWAIALILARDVVVFAAGIYLVSSGRGAPAVTRLGKTATFGIMWSWVPLLGAGIVGTARDPQPVLFAIGAVMLGVSLVLYWATAFDYFRTTWRVATGAPAKAPSDG